MDDLIAKKYAVAILQSGDADEFFENLNSILAAFKDDKFALILQTSEIKKDEKLDFILGFFKNPSKKFNNFLRLLAANSRLNLIPKIAAELARQRALKAQIYSGIIYSQKALDSKDLANLQDLLAKKFKVKIELKNEISKQTGVKIALDELGFQISFSMQDLANKMSEFILKTL